MSKYIDNLSVKFGEAVVRWRWLVLIATLLAAIGVASGARNLTFTSDYRVFFGADNPQLTAYEELQNVYTKTDNILFVLKARDGKIVTSIWMGVVKELTEASWKIPYSIRVDSLTNFQHTEAVEDDLTVTDLVENPAMLDKAAETKVERIAQSEPALAKRLISQDGRTTGVSVTLQLPEDDAVALDAAVVYAEGLLDNIKFENPGLEVAITGLAPLSNAFPRASIKDMSTLNPIMFGIIIVALIGFLRSFWGTAVTLVVTILSTGVAMGFAGSMGIQLTPPSAMAPTIILTIAIADCVHILVTTFHEMRQGKSRHQALIESLRVNMQPVFLTSFTTIIGFLSLNFSDSPPFHDLGNMAAIGVIAAWILSIAFLPAFMAIVPFRVKQREAGRTTMMERLGDFVVAKRKTLLVVMSIIVVGTTAMISRIQLDDRFVEYFDDTIPFRIDSDFTRENLTGIYQIEYSLNAHESGGISDPVYLQNLENFSNWMRNQTGVVHVNTITDVMKRLNKSMHGDDERMNVLPGGRDLAAQYLLLYEMSLPYGLDLNSQINVDKSASRLTVTLDDVSSEELRALAAEGTQWLRSNAPSYMVAEGSGASVMFADIANRNIRSMLGGTAIAFLMISLSMMIALRSIKIGLISLIPNMVPAAMAFGLWGLFVGQIGLAVSVIAATSLGLIVDASVHFLSKYMRARRENGATPADAVRYSFRTVGTALWVTTSVLIMGFAVLALSSFTVNADMGLLTATTIAIALFVDFLLLPPLLLLFEGEKDPVRPNEAILVPAE